jgi:hypothetical protein
MSCTNPNCECKAGSYANLNPPRRVDEQVKTLQSGSVERSKARRVRRGAAAYAVTLAGFKIELKRKSNNNFSVIYGKQFKDGVTYADAAKELGECIMHALALEGKLD